MNTKQYISSIQPNGLTNLVVDGMLFQWNNGWQYVRLFYTQQSSWELDV